MHLDVYSRWTHHPPTPQTHTTAIVSLCNQTEYIIITKTLTLATYQTTETNICCREMEKKNKNKIATKPNELMNQPKNAAYVAYTYSTEQQYLVSTSILGIFLFGSFLFVVASSTDTLPTLHLAFKNH
jgi:hypothetical protein